MQLSVCIITKNECALLEKCLKALQPYDFEVVVADTGSTDGTREMARHYTKQLYDFVWCDDFAAAKNYAISKAANDVVMVLDSDEVICGIDLAELEDLIKRYPEKVGRIELRNQLNPEQAVTENIERINRIFRKSRFHYEGRIHEQITANDKSDYETYMAPVQILHSGYAGTQEARKEKAQRNIKLLRRELEQRPDDAYLLYQLGKSSYMAQDYSGAVCAFEAALGYDLNPKLEYVIDMVETYGYALLHSGQVEKALQLRGVYQEFGDCADFKFLMGLIYMNNEMFEEAVVEFNQAAGYRTARAAGANSYLAYYNAGVIRECLGDTKQAYAYYEKCGDYGKAKERITALNLRR